MKHHALPEGEMTPEMLANWIKQASKDSFVEETKIYFTEEEISDMEKLSTSIGREIIKLSDLKKAVVERLMKGSTEELEVTIPENQGLKPLTDRREALDRNVEKGFEVEEVRVYAIPNEDGNMYFFDIEGNIFTDRTRKLSQREKHEYFGMFVDGSFNVKSN